jgi:hypothetical protein
VTTPFIQLTCYGVEDPIRHTVSCAGTAVDDPAFPVLLDPQAAASPVSAVAAEMATAARLSLTACSLRVAVGVRPAGPGLNPARGAARAGLLVPHDTSSAPLGPGVCVN